MKGHDQSPARNDPDYVVEPPKDDEESEFRVMLGSDGPELVQPSIKDIVNPPAVNVDETTDNPERHNPATFKEELVTCCAAIAMHLKIREVDPWFHGIVAAIDRTSAVWTLSRGDGEWKYLAIVEGNQMFPTPRAIRKAKTFSLALAWAFQDWLEQREQD